MKQSRLVKVSKYLSKHLRHQPERLGLQLQPGGWVTVDDLLEACRKQEFRLTRVELEEVVAKNDKKRFSFDETGSLIRANQGHSVEVDLQLEPTVPPDVLYHGTGKQSVSLILKSGLKKMSRHHVHLSEEIKTAKRVGARHGYPVIFEVNAVAMYGEGFIFYCSENNVWLVDRVPPEYLKKLQV
ncbi:RNA 2'-phosphotransferase [Lusitaniella coriacea LEGE 07157]|uniref:Probable RNA 2'-phosphotransferase n=1 Tax=Lusitaniella coriacea LEGE 07157 TaxID=945747 RepID=A0A8J7E6J3_9CYAN|nr:RNA 2'-phosphotransferase [Lusitaniella coriacea]MBE9119189.1 RNA 2'-phosphotransferase [Lusitaniella coriacea LEGE 07157]